MGPLILEKDDILRSHRRRERPKRRIRFTSKKAEERTEGGRAWLKKIKVIKKKDREAKVRWKGGRRTRDTGKGKGDVEGGGRT